MTTSRHPAILIVGTGPAALATATALRRRRHGGTITLLGDESVLPYDRPPLSKQFLAGVWDDQRLALLPPARQAELDLTLRLGRRASSLDLSKRVVVDQRGELHRYDELVIATGMHPRELPALVDARVHVLRTLGDAQRLRSGLSPSARAVFVGAGLIGLEAAATAARRGVCVTVVEPMKRPLAGRIGAWAAERLLNLHRENGVDLRLGATAAGLTEVRGRPAVLLSTGERLLADTVLVAVGCAPATEWLDGSGLTIDDGVVCDECCRAGEHVWAAGDVARWMHPSYGRSMRIEHRTNATEQGQHVAACITGEPTAYAPVPFFWSDHFDVKVQLAGVIGPRAVETHVDVSDRDDSFVRLFHEGGQLVAALGWNAVRELRDLRRALTDKRRLEMTAA